ncbi:MAG: hypothetical protein WC175_04870 [Candidatus Dojkabacteria bacterium]
MKIKKIVLFFGIGITFLLLFSNKPALSYHYENCTKWGLYCQEPGGFIDTEYWYGRHQNATGMWLCSHSLGRTEWTCEKDPNDASCKSTGFIYYQSLSDCRNGTGQCPAGCCGAPSCDPTPCDPTCDPGTSGTGTSYGSVTATCTNECDVDFSKKCYCTSQCEFAKTCSQGGYKDSNENNGELIYQTCKNYCNQERNLTCYCPAADCKDLDDKVIWSDNQPLGAFRTYEGLVPIPNNPSGCPATQDRTCYIAHTTNAPPTNTLVEIYPVKKPTFEGDTILGYYSNTHSGRGATFQFGGGVNNPVGLRATYSDVNGQQDIQAIYVWWNPSKTKNFAYPNQIKAGQSNTALNNFGFMIARDSYGGNFNSVYVPRIVGTDKIWVKKGNISQTLNISGPSPSDMVKLSDISISNSGTNDIKLDLKMEFLIEGSNDIVSTFRHNLWAMANDYVGFTKFEKDGKIKDCDDWKDSGTDWSLDMVKPSINPIKVTDTGVGEVTIAIDVNDSTDGSIAYISLEACKSGGIDAPTPLSSENVNSYTLQRCNAFTNINRDINSNDDLLGSTKHLENKPSFSFSEKVFLGDNKEGAITFYLTVMDYAGNVIRPFAIYKLEQWAVVKDGFVFGINGVTSSTRELEAGAWDSHSFLKKFDESKIDLTNDVLLGAKSLTSIYLRELVNTSNNESFIAANYPGVFLGRPYAELKMAYQRKTSSSSFQKVTLYETTLTNKLTSYCTEGTPYCLLEKEGDLSITNFTCDSKALIAVNGNVNITPDFVNGSNADACIILASGDINIQAVGTAGDDIPGYDKIQAFLIAGGKINISSFSEGEDKRDQGLYVEGGLVSFASQTGRLASVDNKREIKYSNMGLYPVLIVDNNGKYGLFGKKVFGSQIDVYRTEIGFKPY